MADAELPSLASRLVEISELLLFVSTRCPLSPPMEAALRLSPTPLILMLLLLLLDLLFNDRQDEEDEELT